MKEYKSGEIANIMNISKEMVWYYEKCGVIILRRTENNNYRYYSMEDLFLLIDTLIFSKFDVPIKEIHNIQNENFAEKVNWEIVCNPKYSVFMDSFVEFIGGERIWNLNLDIRYAYSLNIQCIIFP